MIRRVTVENFKKIERETFEFTPFDLIVGINNSGKSTILQALAIWQFAVEQFRNSNRTSGTAGIQIVLPNFTALPVPEFNLLWRNRTERAYPELGNGKKRQEFILIRIEVVWVDAHHEEKSFAVELRYQSSQTVYAIPVGGWVDFWRHIDDPTFPKIAYVPPFSGLEPTERRLDNGPIRQQVGKGQPGSILRNLLLNVVKADEQHGTDRWSELAGHIKTWFDVELLRPRYRDGQDVSIACEYRSGGKAFDIISGGSGFHQVLTLMAFLYGYAPTTILLDEPDAHLHVRLQRDLVEQFRTIAGKSQIQFITATHAEEFMKRVDTGQIMSILSPSPRRIDSVPNVVRAMAAIANDELVQVVASPLILYVEGETDARIMRAWAHTLGKTDILRRFYIKAMGGGDKTLMRNEAGDHFRALSEMVPEVRRHMVFDLDDRPLNPGEDNPVITEWSRRNIENYLLIPEAWERATARKLNTGPLFMAELERTIREHFILENLTRPPGTDWRTLSANIFKRVDGKQLLFEAPDSLFQKLRTLNPNAVLPREDVAAAMEPDELHSDVVSLFGRLERLATN